MGIIRAAAGSLDGMYQDIWREFFYCPSLEGDTLMVRVKKTVGENSGNTGNDDVISNKSVIAVNDGQAAIVVSQGKVIAVYEDPGEHVFEDPAHSGLKGAAKEFGRRFTFAGDAPPITQRVYVINTKEIMGKKLKSEGAIPVHIRDKNTGLSIDGTVSISGTYSYRIADPARFYKFAGPAGDKAWNNRYLSSQMDSEMKTALQPALYQLTSEGVRPNEIPAYSEKLGELIKDIVSKKWCEGRGIEIVSIALGVITPSDTKLVQDIQYAATLAGKAYDFFEITDEAAIKAGVWRCACGAYTTEDICPLCNHRKNQ